MSDDPQPRTARERILRFLEENHSSLDPWCDPETGHFVDEGSEHMAALLDQFAHELAERARKGVDVFEEHVGGFQYSRDVREILDVVDPTTPDPDGWDF